MIPNDNDASAGCLHRGLEEYLHAAADDLTVWESFCRQRKRAAFGGFWVFFFELNVSFELKESG